MAYDRWQRSGRSMDETGVPLMGAAVHIVCVHTMRRPVQAGRPSTPPCTRRTLGR
jgi:hypothetical protein